MSGTAEKKPKAIIVGDVPEGTFGGDHAKHYEEQLRDQFPATVFATSPQEAYKEVAGTNTPFVGEKQDIEYYTTQALEERGYKFEKVSKKQLKKLLKEN